MSTSQDTAESPTSPDTKVTQSINTATSSTQFSDLTVDPNTNTTSNETIAWTPMPNTSDSNKSVSDSNKFTSNHLSTLSKVALVLFVVLYIVISYILLSNMNNVSTLNWSLFYTGTGILFVMVCFQLLNVVDKHAAVTEIISGAGGILILASTVAASQAHGSNKPTESSNIITNFVGNDVAISIFNVVMILLLGFIGM
jgi:hypothetical protein